MSARAGLANIITRLRGMTEAGTADYSLTDGSGTAVVYWSDDHLQTVLSSYQTDYIDLMLTANAELGSGGTVHYYLYDIPVRNLEEASSGTAYWYVRDTTGATVGTANYAVDYVAGQLRFTADTKGTAYYLRCRGYNLNGAAANVWRSKAANAAKYYQFSTSGQSFSKQQFFEHCMTMASYYDKQSGWKVSRRVRTDLLPQGYNAPRMDWRHGPVGWPDRNGDHDLDH